MNSHHRVLLTIAEVAQELSVSRTRAYQLAAEGQIPSVRLSERRIRVPRAAFEAWLAEQSEIALRNLRPSGESAATHDDESRP